ncbi:Cna B-type domain-containing protein [Baileyella intestinalis]|uniref:Cna B-type domain-containing protein n=1 Tax=Baileyella intestinalis TaxID=2606709 RepID=UPI0022E01FA1|nr:Cna B-type domain-containing protein [Baileyella intestinalis]
MLIRRSTIKRRLSAAFVAVLTTFTMLMPGQAFAEAGPGSTTGTGSDVTSHVHAQISVTNDTWEAGVTSIVSFKYTLDRGAIHAGDYAIVTIPEDIASKVSFSLNSQHFSGKEDLGGGRYKIIFGKDIESGLSGSFSAFVTAVSKGTSSTGSISMGEASKKITVAPQGPSSGGSGKSTDTIMKDAVDNPGVSYGGYDYSDPASAAQIGTADLTNGGSFKFRLYINRKEGDISQVTVNDRIPDGMTLDEDKGIQVTDWDTGKTIDPSLYSWDMDQQNLVFKYPGSFSNHILVTYWATVPTGSNTSKFTNTATITYTENGEVHQEHKSYVLQGSANNASNGEKSVDKSEITTDPDDQIVTYTIKFWNSNGFSENQINLTDDLDSHVKFLSAEDNEYFSIKQDKDDPQKIHISNTKAIDGSTTTYVRFTVDMTDVPVGYTVENSVGGNTTKTTKIQKDEPKPVDEKISIDVNGKWFGGMEDHETVYLKANGKVVSKIDLTPDNNWSYTFTDLKKQEEGKDIVYTLETDGADGYTTEITGGRDEGFVVTNTKKKEEKPEVPADTTGTTDKPDSSGGTETADTGDTGKTDNSSTTKEDTTTVSKAKTKTAAPETYDPGKTGNYMLLFAGSAAALILLVAFRITLRKKAH